VLEAGQKRKLQSNASSPGITFVAPVPAWMFETWNVVGGNWAVPRSQRVAASSASAGATAWIGLSAISGNATWPCTPRTSTRAEERAAAAHAHHVAEVGLGRGLADHAPGDALGRARERVGDAAHTVERRGLPRRW
jgi:hypothetical protein